MSRAAALMAFAGAIAVACGERPAPTASVSPPAEATSLRPLTSRDGTTGAPPALPAGHPPVSVGGPAESKVVEGEVRLAARLRDRAGPDGVLFVIARSSATGQVVAVRKEEHARFPFAFRLSAGDTMMEGVPFDGPFDLTARISRSGDAMPQPGDLEGTAKNVAAGARGVAIVVEHVRP